MPTNSRSLLGPAEIRDLAEQLDLQPTKKLGQNFVVDGNTVRKIVRTAGVVSGDEVLEVGPGLGSLTLGLLEAGADVVAVEIDPVLAGLLPDTVRRHVPGAVVDTVDLPDVPVPAAGGPDPGPPPHPSLTVVRGDALDVRALPGRAPTALVANLPYNVSVPVLLTFLEHFPTLERVLVMVQAEVADRVAAPPGSRTYGVPSVKAAWYASARRTATVGRSVFWPVPNVDSALVRLDRREPPATTATREQVFAVVDAAFAQRRKMLRSALATLAGGSEAATRAIEAAGVDPQARGEALDVLALARVAEQLHAPAAG
ncbi:MAG: rRNA adenine dimethyltransferase family protein [Cellulomonas sp.]